MRSTRRRIVAAALGVAWAGLAGAAEDHWAELRRVPVQDAGRIKPLDTFARETARRVTGARVFGAESVAGLDPVEWVVAAWAQPDRWREERVIRVSDASLRTLAGLPADRDKFSFSELLGHEQFMRVAEEARQESDANPDTRLSPPRMAAIRLYDDLVLLSAVLAGEAPRVLDGGTDDGWRSFAALAGASGPEAAPVNAAYQRLLTAYRANDRVALRGAGLGMAKVLGAAQPALAPESQRLDREVDYNMLKPFRLAWCIYLLALVPLLSSFPLKSRALTAIGYAAMLAGFLVQSYGIFLRALVAGRPPVTNMYESIVFAAWGAVGLGLAWELRSGTRLFAACAAAVAVPFLLVADAVPMFDSAIDPLSPVLRDNFWLTSHVLTITLGYAALFLALALGHVSLALQFRHAAEGRVRTVSNFLHRVMQAGTLLLAAGTLLGGVWASYSWGRFWGWDPKETWALIALLVYLAILHARFAGWIHDLGLALGSIAGGLSVLMAWYGVNYVLGTGLHSYGFGSGGANAWVLAYVVLEVGLMFAGWWRIGRAEFGRPLPSYTLANTAR